MNMNPAIIPKFKNQRYPVPKSGIMPALLLAVLAGLSSIALPAQQTTEEKDKEESDEFVVLNPFIVTGEVEGQRLTTLGNRTVKAVVDIPSVINFVDRQMLDDTEATYMHQAVRFAAAGITRSASTSDDSSIRGFRARSPLRDGVIYRTERPMQMYDVERIEIIKGPAGLMLGNTDYLGGVMNTITKRPTDTFKSDASVTYGTGNNLMYSANVSGPLTKSDDFTALYRVTIGGANGDGKIHESAMSSTDQKFIGAGASFIFFGSRIQLDMNAHFYKDDGFHYFNAFLDTAGLTTWSPSLNNQATSQARFNRYSTPSFAPGLKRQSYMHSSTRFAQVVLTARLTENGSLRLAYTSGDGQEDWRIVRGISMAADNVTMNRQDLKLDIKSPSHVLEWEWLYRTTRKEFSNDFQIGGNASQWSAWQGVRVDTPPPLNTASPDYTYNQASYNFSDPNNYTAGVADAVTTAGTVFAQNNVSLFGDRLILIGGVRLYDANTKTLDLRTNSYRAPADTGRLNLHRYGVVVKPVKWASLFYSDSNNVLSNLGLNTNAQPFLDSEGTMKEFGLKLDYSTERFTVFANFASFDMALSNVRTSVVDPSNPQGFVFIQTKSNETKGWEAEIGGRWKGDSGYADFIVTHADIETVNALDGGQASAQPDKMNSFFVKYSWTDTPLKGIAIGGGIITESQKRIAAYLYTIPDLVSVFVKYRYNDHWTFQLNGDNVTDESYMTGGATPGLMLRGETAQYRFSATYHW